METFANVRCDAREENGEKCRASIEGGSTEAVRAKMAGRWTTVGRRHYCPDHKGAADERAEFEARADACLDGVLARARVMALGKRGRR